MAITLLLEEKGRSLLFFVFEHTEVPDDVLEPLLQELPQPQTWSRTYHLKEPGQPESTRYYGCTDDEVMSSLRQALQQRELSFREVPEGQLPEWQRRELANIRRNS